MRCSFCDKRRDDGRQLCDHIWACRKCQPKVVGDRPVRVQCNTCCETLESPDKTPSSGKSCSAFIFVAFGAIVTVAIAYFSLSIAIQEQQRFRSQLTDRIDVLRADVDALQKLKMTTTSYDVERIRVDINILLGRVVQLEAFRKRLQALKE